MPCTHTWVAISQVPKPGRTDATPCPIRRHLHNTLSKFGITSGVQVVAYDQDNGMYASRLWWMLRWLGHDAAAVLDGGFRSGSRKAGRPRLASRRAMRKRFVGAPRAEMAVDAPQVASLVRHADWRLVDARAPERFRGETEPIDRTPGHIPGAANHFYQTNLDDQGIFRSPEELRDDWREVARRPSLRVTSSVTAARASPRATTCSRSSTRASKARSCIPGRGANGRQTLRGRWSEADRVGLPYADVAHSRSSCQSPKPVGPYSPGMGFER